MVLPTATFGTVDLQDVLQQIMDSIPSFDDLLTKTVLPQLGLPALAISVYAVAKLLQSYIDAAFAAYAGAKASGRLLLALTQFRAVQGVASVVVTALVPVAQVLTLVMCFLGGNYISLLFHEDRFSAIVEAVQAHPPDFLSADGVLRILLVDVISGTYLAFAATLVLLSYLWARNEDRLRAAGLWMALPAVIIIGIAVLALGADALYSSSRSW